MSSLQRHLRALEARVTDQPLESFERLLVCPFCKVVTGVFEASMFPADSAGWTTQEGYECLRCGEKRELAAIASPPTLEAS